MDAHLSFPANRLGVKLLFYGLQYSRNTTCRRCFCGYNKYMDIDFDATKDDSNRAKHGVSLSAARQLEWDTAIVWPDNRKDYGEARQCGIGYIGLTLYVVVFVDRNTARRIISLRRANRKEVNRYANA